MNLRSDNAGNKRPKHSSFPITKEIKQNEEEDKISILPDEILTHILSFLPQADAYRTRILSNRWNHLFFFLPSLRFFYSYKSRLSVEEFHDFVEKSLAFRNRDMPVIKRFFLSCSYTYDHNRVLDWLRIVLDSKVLPTLELRFPSDKDRFRLSCDMLMTCNNTLVDLTLKNVDMVGLDETRLPSLKRLRIVVRCRDKAHKVVIDAPKLEYFYIIDYSSTAYSLTNSSSLVEAHIDIYIPRDIQLLRNVSSARILTLGRYFLSVLHENPRLNIPVFPNFVKLIVEFNNIPNWHILFTLLNKMPNLQHITIHFGSHLFPFTRICNPPKKAPACLRFMLKEVVILNQYAPHVEDHVTLITYLLNHSRNLEKLTLSTNNINHERHEKLLKIQRRSKSCQIEFV